MIIGIIGEWLCQLPPNEGPENPKIREAKRRSDIAQATSGRGDYSYGTRTIAS